MSQNVEALLRHIDGEPPFTILDFGCGPGRDLARLPGAATRRGTEAAVNLVAMARDDSGCEVWQQDFLALDLPPRHFDGIFANASLFHVPSQELPRVLRELHATLKPGGVLFAPIRAATTRKAGKANATAPITTSRRGAATSARRASLRWSTTTARPDCRANSNSGWRACGVASRQPALPPASMPG